MLRKIFMAVFMLMLPAIALGQVSEAGKPIKVVTDADIVGTTVWSRDTVWNMSGFLFVENGEILIIEPGTIIKGDPGTAENATALIVAKGGKIYAEGTPTQPIIFTSISDDVDDPNDIALGAAGRGLWGSVIILGDARLNTASGTAQIEGIPGTEVRGNYGGTDDNDNSGVFRYVSLRHGGSIIGAANEINGLTMGGVGRGTVIDHIEAYQNLDDG
ncbi:MAG: T9SS C-terminal target domain-containing protein, partial [candidate division Zixibacteria bacterium]|nr:T9SS C-terminal target domain-containing protein [candidate division Zixibacteria bacterium]